jgi:phosphomannomutase
VALFGTDGIRGTAGSVDSLLNPQLVNAIGVATGIVFKNQAQILIGRDTRKSGVEIEQALIAGLTSAGVNVTLIRFTLEDNGFREVSETKQEWTLMWACSNVKS